VNFSGAKTTQAMGEYIPEVDAPDIYEKLETLIRCQLTEEKSVGDKLVEGVSHRNHQYP
jgi:hypothetical protein